jgi:hypothetical protein
MNRKTLLILFLIFIVLGIISFYPQWTGLIQKIHPVNQKSELEFLNLNKENLTSFKISKNTEKLEFKKDGSTWKVASFSASTKIIDNFIDDLKNISVESMVSKNPENQAEFGLDSSQKTDLDLVTTVGEYKLSIGNSGPGTGTWYVKKTASSNIYLANVNFGDILKINASDWRDKTITSIAIANLYKIEIQTDRTYSLSKKDNGKWELQLNNKNTELKDEDVNFILNQVTVLSGYEFLNDSEKDEFDKIQNKFRITFKDQKGVILSEFEFVKKDSDIWVFPKGKSDYLKAYSSELDSLLTLPDKKN